MEDKIKELQEEIETLKEQAIDNTVLVFFLAEMLKNDVFPELTTQDIIIKTVEVIKQKGN